jgi:hypothetical protein
MADQANLLCFSLPITGRSIPPVRNLAFIIQSPSLARDYPDGASFIKNTPERMLMMP